MKLVENVERFGYIASSMMCPHCYVADPLPTHDYFNQQLCYFILYLIVTLCKYLQFLLLGTTDIPTSKRKNLKRSHVATKSNVSDSEDDCPATTNGYKLVDGYGSSSTDSDFEYQLHTPPTKRRTVSQSDSGFGTCPSSHRSTRLTNFSGKKAPETSSQNGHTSDEEHKSERFRKRIRKARMNFRNRVCANDSDSN